MRSVVAEKNSVCARNVPSEEMSAVAIDVQRKLVDMGGGRPLKTKVGVIREYLSKVRPNYWRHTAARGRIKRFLYGEQKPSIEEAQDIAAAHARFCPEKIEWNRQENAALIQSVIEFAERARRVDEEFYAPHLDALRASLLRMGLDVPVDKGTDRTGTEG